MSDFQLLDSYTNYKSKEKRWTQWLVGTAEKAGAKILDKITVTKKKGDSSASHNVSHKYLLSLANSIVNGHPPQPVPETFYELLRDVISLRKEVSLFYKTRSRDEDEENAAKSQESHMYYINVLEDVLRTLKRGKMESRPRASSSNDTTTQDEAKPSNVFNILEIEDINLRDNDNHQHDEEDSQPEGSSDKENVTNQKPRKTKKKTKKSSGKGKKAQKPKKDDSKALAIKNPITDFDIFTPKIEYEIAEDGEEEYYIKIYCFLRDFHQIRNWLQERFCDYQDGLCSLIEVSVATNTAFDLFQRLERNLVKVLPDFDFESVAMHIFCEVGVSNLDEPLDRKSQSGQNTDDDLGAEWDWLCLDTYHSLKKWLGFAPPRKIPTGMWHAKGYARSEGPTAPNVPNYQTQDQKKMLLRDEGIINEFLAECCFIKGLERRKTFCMSAEDELTKGTINMLHSRVIPTWLVFAFKVYVDLRLILEADVERGHRDLMAVGERSKPRLLGYNAYLEGLDLEPSSFVSNRIAEIDCWILQDWAGKDRKDLHVRHGERASDVEPYFFFRRNPIQCGLISFANALTMNETGLEVANQWGAIIAVTHLYNAVRQEIPSFPLWQDMEALVLVHGQRRIFWDGIPTSPARYLKSYDSSTGIGSMVTQTNRLKKKHGDQWANELTKPIKPDHVEYRGLTPVSVVSWLFHERYCFGRKSLEAGVSTLPNVEKILNYMSQNEMQLQIEGLEKLALPPTEIDASKRRAIADRQQSNNSMNSSLTKQFQKSRSLTSIQLLDALWNRTSQERMTLAFDYFSMHDRCTRVLREVHAEFKKEFEEMNDAAIQEEEGMLPMVPYLVFKMMEEGKWGSRSDVAERLAKILGVVVEKEGDREILEVRSVMLGNLGNTIEDQRES